jgi:hypothetical protein
MFARRVLVMCVEYIQLENLTYGMKQPCVCDLKMGGNSKGAFKAVFCRLSLGAQGHDRTIGSPTCILFVCGLGCHQERTQRRGS